MARPLNTQKLLKQCQAIGRKQEAAKVEPTPPPTKIIEIKEELDSMTPLELEQYLTNFQQMAREANRRYEEAVALEQLPNSAIQDILHAAEFSPSVLDGVNVTALLHKYRSDRRSAKQELEVTEIFKQWAEENRAAINKLDQVIGAMRKVMRRQPNDFYTYKTNAVLPQGSFLTPDEKGELNEDSEV